jgi:hypothetical protein
MAQAARCSAWPSSQVEQAEKQARVWADGLVELHERTDGRFGRVEGTAEDPAAGERHLDTR